MQTRFDLTAAFTNWQQELTQQPDLTPVVQRELETHLRDTIAELQSRGLNNEESFWLARRRVGRPEQLAEEFAKADPAEVWRNRLLWIVGALLVIALWDSLVWSLLSRPLMTVADALGGELSMLNAIFWLAGWLPVALAVVFLAKRGLKLTWVPQLRFLGSRLGIATIVALFIFAANSARIVSMWEGLTDPALNGVIGNGVDWNNLWFSIVWPFILLGLMLWLMPRANRQTPAPEMA